MAEDSILTDDFVRELINVGEVDILVGVPTYNNAKTIEPAIQAIQAGILRAFPRERAVIINADGGSTDGTPELVTGASISDSRRTFNGYTLRTLHSISTQYAPSPSSGIALQTILSAAELLRAKACAVISPDSVNVEAEWITKLLDPVYKEKYDFVAPLYRRNRFEGVLLTNLVYPMTRAMFGKKVREPYASEFSFSGNLGGRFLAQHDWRQEFDQPDPRMDLTISALAGDYRVYQTFLGDKSQDRQTRDLVQAMRQTIGVVFASLQPNLAVWSSRNGAQPVPGNGSEHELVLDPLRVNRKQLKQMFSAGVADLESVLSAILKESTLTSLKQIAALGEDEMRYPADLWVKTVYEFAASYNKPVMSRDHIVQALAPLYRGRMFTFLVENRNGSAEDVENNIESLCLEFERGKPYLLELWNGGK